MSCFLAPPLEIHCASPINPDLGLAHTYSYTLVVADDFSADLECDEDAPHQYDVVETHKETSGPLFQRKTYNNDVSVNDRPTKCGGDVEGPQASASNTKRSVSALLDGSKL